MLFDFHPEALVEYLAAIRYYDERRTGLGARFSVEIEAAIQRILEAPERWPSVSKNIRRCRTRSFPYSVMYSIDARRVFVHAVAHDSRAPGYWRGRVSGGA